MFKNIYDVRSLCKAVKIHHSVYYYHKQNKENSYKKANEELDKRIKEEYEKSKKRYCSPKITKILNKQGIKVSQKRVARRMKVLGLKSIDEEYRTTFINFGKCKIVMFAMAKLMEMETTDQNKVALYLFNNINYT